MSSPKKFERLGVEGNQEGNQNQIIKQMLGGTAIGSVGGDVNFVAKKVMSPFQLPIDVADFTGRETELAQIEAVLGGAGDAGAVAISAVAGMGVWENLP